METTKPQAPVRRRPRAAAILSLTALGIALAAGGFAAGRISAPPSDTSAIDCTELKAEVVRIGQAGDGAQAQTGLRTAVHLILQNPDCFSASQRASAQTALDTLDANSAQDTPYYDPFTCTTQEGFWGDLTTTCR
jgi:hypothetical protein